MANSWESMDGQWVNAEVARWLERDLDDARARASKLADVVNHLRFDLAQITAAIHRVHPTRRGSLADMIGDLDSYRETAMSAFRLSEKELAAEREQIAANHKATDILVKMIKSERGLADGLAETLDGLDWLADNHPQSLAAWKEARRGTF